MCVLLVSIKHMPPVSFGALILHCNLFPRFTPVISKFRNSWAGIIGLLPDNDLPGLARFRV